MEHLLTNLRETRLQVFKLLVQSELNKGLLFQSFPLNRVLKNVDAKIKADGRITGQECYLALGDAKMQKAAKKLGIPKKQFNTLRDDLDSKYKDKAVFRSGHSVNFTIPLHFVEKGKKATIESYQFRSTFYTAHKVHKT